MGTRSTSSAPLTLSSEATLSDRPSPRWAIPSGFSAPSWGRQLDTQTDPALFSVTDDAVRSGLTVPQPGAFSIFPIHGALSGSASVVSSGVVFKQYPVSYVASDWADLPFTIQAKQVCLVEEASSRQLHMLFVSPQPRWNSTSSGFDANCGISYLDPTHPLASAEYTLEHIASFSDEERVVLDWAISRNSRSQICSLGVALLSFWEILDTESRNLWRRAVRHISRFGSCNHVTHASRIAPGYRRQVLAASPIGSHAPPRVGHGTFYSESTRRSPLLAA
jgi:hypothetical protein